MCIILKKGDLTMFEHEDYKPISPQEMLDLYQNGGRQALIEKLCIFPEDLKHLNETMEQMVDVAIAAFNGTLPIDKMADEMERIGAILKEQVCDLALDRILETENEEEKGELFEALSYLNDETSSMPNREVKPNDKKLSKFGPSARQRAKKRLK